MTEPTDAELNELADIYTPNTETGSLNYRKFARAVLAPADSVTAPAGPSRFADVIAVQRSEAEADTSDAYMVGLYNGMSMMDANYRNITDWEPMLTAPRPCPAKAADSVLEDAASAGFFLQLPQRPKPEAPAGTVGLDWDAYSGAQMLAYGRDCSDAAIVAAQKPGGL